MWENMFKKFVLRRLFRHFFLLKLLKKDILADYSAVCHIDTVYFLVGLVPHAL